jgi:hypothetical protein
MQGGREQQENPEGYVFVREVYTVTWSVPEEEASEFMQNRRSKKEDFAKQQHKDMKGRSKAQHIDQHIEQQEKQGQ